MKKHIRKSYFKPFMSGLLFSVMLFTGVPGQGAGPSADELGDLIDQMVNRKMANLGKQMGVVINLSGRQRMLTQKMSKEMLLIYLGVEPDENQLNLGNSAILFSDTLKGLVNGDKSVNLGKTTDPDILKQMHIVSGLWASFSQYVLVTLEAQIDKSFIEKVAQENLPLLEEMNKAVYMYEKAAGADLADLAPVVNLSGRQRMLTQKMTKEFLLIAAGISVQENQANLLKTVALFDRTLKGLRDGDAAQRLPGTPQPHVRAQLDIIEQRWDAYRPVLEQQDFSEAQILRAAELNLPLLKEMNTAVKMYEVLSDSAK
ncbi:MAG: hypothetical protein GY697_11230 [Desulfobacterales bacterium]|nr:hypothetical protein [Desulfobacterales bacterium]